MKAALIIELDLPGEELSAGAELAEVVAAIGWPPYAVGLHAAVREVAAEVLGVIDRAGKQRALTQRHCPDGIGIHSPHSWSPDANPSTEPGYWCDGQAL